MIVDGEGKSLIFPSYTVLKITKKSHAKITKSQKNHMRISQNHEIVERLHEYSTKYLTKMTKIPKIHRKDHVILKAQKSCALFLELICISVDGTKNFCTGLNSDGSAGEVLGCNMYLSLLCMHVGETLGWDAFFEVRL